MPTTQLPPSLVAALRASGAGESAGSVREWIEQGGKGRGDNGLGQVLSAIDALWHGSPCALPSSSRTEGGRHLRQNSGRSCSLGTANVTQPAQVAVGSGSERPMAVNLPHGGATVAHCAAAATAERRAAAAAARVKATEVDRSNALIDPLLATGPGTDDGADDGGLRGALRGLRSVEARLSSLRAWQTTSSTQRSPFNISEQDLASPTASDLFRTRESCAGTGASRRCCTRPATGGSARASARPFAGGRMGTKRGEDLAHSVPLLAATPGLVDSTTMRASCGGTVPPLLFRCCPSTWVSE